MKHERVQPLLMREEFPLANKYDPNWVLEHQMGPNALWLTEWLCTEMDLHSGMRVLDLGCGRGLSSILLAREYGVQVWATDLWINATDNLGRIQEAGLSDHIFPIQADARDLPYAEAFFDAILCVDAYIYFGTDDLYLDYLHRFVKPGGQLGIVVPGFMQEVDGPLPEHLHPFWAQECWTWHTLPWWERHWRRTGLVEIEVAATMPDGWKVWLQWEKARLAAASSTEALQSDISVLEADKGEFMGFIKMIARRKSWLSGTNLVRNIIANL
jgi:cyclopropane fatty-acyl-phospholipid synthase-like methyltransferase